MIDLVFTEPKSGIGTPVKQIIQDEGIDVDPDTISVVIQRGEVTIRILDDTLTETEITALEDAMQAEYTDVTPVGRMEHANIRGFEASQRARERAPGLSE